MALDRIMNKARTEAANRFGLKTDAEIDAFFIGMGECAKDNQEALEKRDKMLRDTIAELCEAKRLLKSAIDEWPFLCEWGDCGEHCEWFANGKCNQEWSNKTEALALIGKDGDTE